MNNIEVISNDAILIIQTNESNNTLIEINNSDLSKIEKISTSETLIIKDSPDLILTEVAQRGLPGRNGYLGGWVFYKDNQYTINNKRLIPSNQRTRIINNGLDLLSNETFKPNTSIWWNKNTNKFQADKFGDVFFIRLNLRASSSINNRLITLDFDIGTTNPIAVEDLVLARGADVIHQLSINFIVAAGNSMLQNGATFNIKSNGDIYIWDVSFLIQKTFENVT
jgi:hypothetical protein